jgi:hypothetical protein
LRPDHRRLAAALAVQETSKAMMARRSGGCDQKDADRSCSVPRARETQSGRTSKSNPPALALARGLISRACVMTRCGRTTHKASDRFLSNTSATVSEETAMRTLALGWRGQDHPHGRTRTGGASFRLSGEPMAKSVLWILACLTMLRRPQGSLGAWAFGGMSPWPDRLTHRFRRLDRRTRQHGTCKARTHTFQ